VAVTTVTEGGQIPTWRSRAASAARGLAAVTAAGALLGLLVGGVGGRLAMLVLARLNPRASGVTSDDGFTIGQLTLAGSLNLLLAGGMLGVLGAALYAVLRELMVGPRWFEVLSIAVGPAVVVGELLVHVDGVDFTLLEPAGLAIAMFVLIPGVYAALLTVLAERWRRPDGFFAHGPLPLVLTPLLAFLPLAPLLLVLAVGWVLTEAVRRRCGGVVPGSRALAWAARAALAVLFCLSLARLVEETQVLV
jgi:hypothetical protein